MSPLPHGFFRNFKYPRDMTILKILASISKWFRIYGIFNKWKIDDDIGGGQILHFLRSFALKIIYGLKNSPGYDFWLKKLKNDIIIALNPAGINL